jgi:hypothetical protein
MQKSTACLLALALACPLLGCTDCERDGCDALEERAEAAGPGVGGVVALQSDVVNDGCAECPLGAAHLDAWRVDAPVTTIDEAVAVVHGRDPDLTQDVSGRYHLALEPAAYLVCVRPDCVAVTITAETTTLNLERREGPTRFFIGQPNVEGLQEARLFTVRY